MPDTLTNNPPHDADPVRDRLTEEYVEQTARCEELLEAVNRVPDSVEDDVTAGKVADFIKQIGAAVKNAEAARKAEKEPYLANGRAVDGWFKRLTDPLAKAKKDVEARLTVYQRQKAAEERRVREEEERRQREEADRLRKEAEEKAAELADEDDLDKAIAAAAEAKQAEADAAQAQKDADAKAAELSRTRGEYGGVASLVTFWDFKDIDRGKLDLEALRPHLPSDALEKAVRSFIKAGGRDLRGVEIFENTKTRVA